MPTSAAATPRAAIGSTTVQPSARRKASGNRNNGTANIQSTTPRITNQHLRARGTSSLLASPERPITRHLRPGLRGNSLLSETSQRLLQILRDRARRRAATLREERPIARAQPHLSRCILPHEGFQRQVDPDRLGALHERRPALRTAQDEYFGWPEHLADSPRSRRELDSPQHRQAFLFSPCLAATHAVFHVLG